jgi:hypothetical protein
VIIKNLVVLTLICSASAPVVPLGEVTMVGVTSAAGIPLSAPIFCAIAVAVFSVVVVEHSLFAPQ